MCGLVAYFRRSEGSFDPVIIEQMTDAMANRGPDDYGYCALGEGRVRFWRESGRPTQGGAGVLMGHRRLAIFDLTSAGRQPFTSADGRFTIVFNGEIYNFLELRSELEPLGHRFETECDTEVLVAAYAQWGTDCLRRLNGVFAFALWDEERKSLLVVRDRLGEKPLYFTRIGSDWIFASEIKALLVHPQITAEPDGDVVLRFLQSSRFPEGEESFFANIRTFPAGSFLELAADGERSESYWNLPFEPDKLSSDMGAASERLDELLRDAVRIRLRSDIRVGTLLSGGLDSTSIVANIVDILRTQAGEARALGNAVQAFNASFPGLENDESEIVAEVCNALEIGSHSVLPMDEPDIEACLSRIAFDIECPFPNSATIVLDLLCRRARSEKVPILLGGLGGDEMFGGYADKFGPQAVEDHFRAGRPYEGLRELLAQRRLHGLAAGKTLANIVVPWRLRQARQAGRRSDIPGVSPRFRPVAPSENGGPRIARSYSKMDRELRNMLLVSNCPPWLQMSDKLSMGSSVVIRSPLFDYRIVEFAFGLDNPLKIHRGVTKRVLRETMRGRLPESVLSEASKKQMQGANDFWLNRSLRPRLKRLLEDQRSVVFDYVEAGQSGRVIEEFLRSGRYREFVWRLVNTDIWLQRYFGEGAA